MKKVLAIVFVMVMTLNLCACANENPYPEYDYIDKMLASGNYLGAIDAIYDLYSGNSEKPGGNHGNDTPRPSSPDDPDDPTDPTEVTIRPSLRNLPVLRKKNGRFCAAIGI